MSTAHILYDSFGRGVVVTDAAGTVPGVRIGAIGASITAAHGARPGNELSVMGYLTWAMLLSDGRIKYAGHAAAGGITSTDVLATSLPALRALPGGTFHYVVIDAFTNDMGAVALSQSRLNLDALVGGVTALGAVPVLTNVPPRTDGSVGANLAIATWNAYLARYAELNGHIYVDWHSPLVDAATNDYAAGMLLDGDVTGLHPSPAAVRRMGQALVDALPVAPARAPKLRSVGADPLDLVAGGLFLTNTAGLGTGYTALSEGTGYAVSCAASAPKGFWQSVTQVSGLTWIVSPAFALVAGRRYRWSGLLDVVSVGAGCSINLQIVNASGGTTIGTDEATQIGWHTVTIDERAFELDFVCPAGVTSGLLSLRAEGGAATVRIAQQGLVDLTALDA